MKGFRFTALSFLSEHSQGLVFRGGGKGEKGKVLLPAPRLAGLLHHLPDFVFRVTVRICAVESTRFSGLPRSGTVHLLRLFKGLDRQHLFHFFTGLAALGTVGLINNHPVTAVGQVFGRIKDKGELFCRVVMIRGTQLCRAPASWVLPLSIRCTTPVLCSN